MIASLEARQGRLHRRLGLVALEIRTAREVAAKGDAAKPAAVLWALAPAEAHQLRSALGFSGPGAAEIGIGGNGPHVARPST